MESLLNSVLTEINDSPTGQIILRYVPRFIAYANTLIIPGSEKKATVMRGLHELIEALKHAEKISAELQTELDHLIDLSVPPMIEAILDVAAGRVEIKMPTTVAEVVPKINCLLALVQSILRIAGKPKEASVVGDVSNTVRMLTPALEAPKEAPIEDVKAI